MLSSKAGEAGCCKPPTLPPSPPLTSPLPLPPPPNNPLPYPPQRLHNPIINKQSPITPRDRPGPLSHKPRQSIHRDPLLHERRTGCQRRVAGHRLVVGRDAAVTTITIATDITTAAVSRVTRPSPSTVDRRRPRTQHRLPRRIHIHTSARVTEPTPRAPRADRAHTNRATAAAAQRRGTGVTRVGPVVARRHHHVDARGDGGLQRGAERYDRPAGFETEAEHAADERGVGIGIGGGVGEAGGVRLDREVDARNDIGAPPCPVARERAHAEDVRVTGHADDGAARNARDVGAVACVWACVKRGWVCRGRGVEGPEHARARPEDQPERGGGVGVLEVEGGVCGLRGGGAEGGGGGGGEGEGGGADALEAPGRRAACYGR
ncbi:hypothetical protein M8818_002786 [Zalaria obscura]|uniref:Uncharacterized protein n=1 Tax=Zalaria obscura TaxID=2024903 RepID=A0ACC3SK00_9PEZI